MFISRDPIGLMGGVNVFAYAPNPTGWIDPWGLSGDEILTFYHAGQDLTGVEIDPMMGKLNKDFNPKSKGGFYVTTDLSQAQEWQRARNLDKITKFEVPKGEFNKLNVKKFLSADKEWSDFVTKGRKGTLNHMFDAVSGPMLRNVQQFWRGAAPKAKGTQLAIFSKKAAQLFDKCKVN